MKYKWSYYVLQGRSFYGFLLVFVLCSFPYIVYCLIYSCHAIYLFSPFFVVYCFLRVFLPELSLKLSDTTEGDSPKRVAIQSHAFSINKIETSSKILKLKKKSLIYFGKCMLCEIVFIDFGFTLNYFFFHFCLADCDELDLNKGRKLCHSLATGIAEINHV